MIDARSRGLANLHVGATTLGVTIFFWVYAHFVYHVPFVHLNRDVNLLPYSLCVIGGMLLSTRDVSRLAARFNALDLGGTSRLAARQVALMALLTFTMMFATRDHSISRLFLGSFLVWCWIGLSALNARLPRALARLVFRKGHRLPTVFVGRLASLQRLHGWIANKEHLGIHPVGLLSADPLPADPSTLPVPWLGGMADLPQVLEDRSIGQVIVLELPASDEEARSIIEACRGRGCRLLIHNNIDERYTQPLVPITEEGRHFYTLLEEPLEDPLNRLMKRAYDIALSLPVVVAILPPLCVGVAVVQRIQAPGPLFHARERRGKREAIFRMLKFRTMYAGPADVAAESRQASSEDGRVFPFGRFLRRRSLDEFPQFWNVLTGDMSIVGPRPYMPLLDEEFRLQTRGYRTRQLVRPGITGLAQSLGYRGAVLNDEMLHRRVYWDVHYIAHWSIWLDLQVTVRTLWQVVRPPKTAF